MNKIIYIVLVVVVLNSSSYQAFSQSDELIELKIKPSITDATIKNTDVAHFIMYDNSNPQGKLLLFLPGTNGIPEKGPKAFFKTAIKQGYRVINLSYINKQAVARICKGENLANDSDCTKKFRERRIFGNVSMPLIPDEPQDAIVNRLAKLLIHLNETDKKSNWDIYLNNDKPNWNMITVAGQSQGGGMAAFIAKQELVNRIITFSGGWDYSEVKKIAKWYYNKSITPAEKWFGFYHTLEPNAKPIAESYEAMGIPNTQTYSLSLKVREGRRAHGEGIRNTIYIDKWIEALGDGNL
ncbi:BPSS1187 family protein [Winogradskyella immobilis]|uniref:Alpha/beta hydrolase family protein n=1 Tax=Winogradskyella immobilis TaxID=2816852 RepID=A0ABS8EQ13_9FLAO|nr:hypothetical protein [Winogradskyella immobilis]MCC1485091.1 hypothetical protein [Winogradskyella immobilis]MCG0017183.1 hypothetical protein [Winogradskyella immobilis]